MTEAMSRGSVAIIILVGVILFLLCVLSLGSEDASATTFHVPDSYPTIQSAIYAAGPGDEVYVRKGTYKERIRINKAITLQGAVMGSTLLKPTKTGTIITLLAPGITIRNIDIQGDHGNKGIVGANVMDLSMSGVSIEGCDVGISIDLGKNLEIISCTVKGSRTVGIHVTGNVTERFELIKITNSMFNGNIGPGIHLERCRYVGMEGNSVNNNGRAGIIAHKVAHATVKNSTFNSNLIGLKLEDSHGWMVEDNVISMNQWEGLELNNSGEEISNQLRRNMITGNSLETATTYAGISFIGWGASDNLLEYNLISDNPVGIRFSSSTGGCWLNNFHLNDISDCVYAIIEKRGTGPNTFWMNNFKNNVHQASVLNERSLFDINGLGNYWSDYTRWNSNSERIGNVWSIPYKVDPDADLFDHFPLVYPFESERPVVDLGKDRYATLGVPETFEVWFTDQSGIDLFEWTITPPGGKSFSVGRNHLEIDFTFKNIGTFWVMVNLTDVWGNSAGDTIKVVVIDDVPPVAVAGDDIYVDQGTPVTLDGTFSSDNQGIASIHWVFDPDGENMKFQEPIVTLTIDDLGTYVARLFVVDYSGNSATDSLIIHIQDLSSPVAIAGPDTSVQLGNSKTFDGSRSYDNVGIVEYRWTMSKDGSMMVFKQAVVTYTFTELGKYTFTLRVTDEAGHFDIDQLIVSVIDTEPPVANAGGDTSVLMGTEVTFNAAGSTDNVGITVFTWSFHYLFGTHSLNGRTAVWQFNQPGEYAVTLMAFDEAGNFGTDSMMVTVHDSSSPKAIFQIPEELKLGTSFVLDGSLSDDNLGVVSYEWKVTHKTVTHTFYGVMVDYPVNEPGAYRVVLKVTDEAGNEDYHASAFTIPPKASVTDAPGWLMPAMVVGLAAAVLVSYAIGRRLFGREE